MFKFTSYNKPVLNGSLLLFRSTALGTLHLHQKVLHKFVRLVQFIQDDHLSQALAL